MSCRVITGTIRMEADKDLYFKGYYIPRPFSLLVKGGTTSVLQQELQSKNEVAAYDMQGISRIQQQGAQDLEKIDAGAYAYLGGSMRMPRNEGEIIKRIFVSLTANVELSNEEAGREDELKGRSFYTGLASLDEALDYINKVRATDFGEDTDFEIWMAEGTYKPRNARKDADPETGEPNQRQNSFIIPQGVQIFGGFSGNELYSYGLAKLDSIGSLTDLKGDDTDIFNLLDARESGDLNSNGITEPWEMAHPTILSGHVNLSAKEKNVYHVLYSKADAQVSGLGGVTLDGLTIMDGETYNVMKGRSEVGRGAGIYTVGVDYKLVRCRLLNNKAVRGGAVYALNANVTSVGSIFAGNGTVEDAKVDDAATTGEGQNIRGGALYLAGADGSTYWLKAVNTLWANNGTDMGMEDNPSWGGAVAVSGTGEVDLMNNTFVRNKAGQYAAVYVESTTTNASKMTNTAVWGNECEGSPVYLAATGIEYSAFDVELGLEQTNGFVLLDQENNAVNGPRFDDPSTVAGTEGNKVSAKWEPVAISVLVDAGDGQLAAAESDMTQATGAYKEWMTGDFASYNTLYMKSTASRYAGPTGRTVSQWLRK